ncbi:uncharacterized protein LOC134285160 [Aedes albopictus]|uniref:RNA-directed DNA polymerase n=1 Tax=Aedes albopictus TaxID=7160 RepID=A0ABM1ZZN2_AEDAL
MPAHERLYIEHSGNNLFLLNIASVAKPKTVIKYLLDSGSCFNLLRWDTAFRIGVENINYNDKEILRGFANSQTRSIGSTLVKLKIGNSHYNIKFYIIKNLCVPGIIGADFLKQNTLYVGPRFKYIALRKTDECTKLLNMNENSPHTMNTYNIDKRLIKSEKECQTESVNYSNAVSQQHGKLDLAHRVHENNYNNRTRMVTENSVSFQNKSQQSIRNATNIFKDTTMGNTKHFPHNKCNVEDKRDNANNINIIHDQRTNFTDKNFNDDSANWEAKAEGQSSDHNVNKYLVETTTDIDKVFLEDLDSDQDLSLLDNRSQPQMEGKNRLTKLVETINLTHLNRANFNAMEEIMTNYSDVFYLKGDQLTITNAAVHEIETTTNVPINKRQYRFPESTKKQINAEIEEMHRQGIIKPSKSPWNAPVLCIPKKDLDSEGNKKYRIVVDFRALNLVTKPFVYPIPLINDILDSLGDSQYFSTIDLKSGFYQVPINPKDAAKTAFSTPKGHFEFTRMPMGLRNSPSTFQKLMNTVLFEIKDVKAIVYLDDIIVFGRTIEEHNENLKKVLEALRRHNLKVEPTKCQILKTDLKFLGHAVDKHGIRPLTDNIKAIKNMPVPKTIKQVRSFLGTVNFYGKFIPKIAEIRKPLNDLLRKNVKFNWTEECKHAFEKLKCFLTSDSLLVRPNYKDTFVLTTDASEYAIGAVLSNEKSIDKPIAYASRGLIGAERKYHTIEKELLAIVWAVNYFRHYIYNQKFIVYTDHRPLISLWHLKETSPTLTRLRLKLQGLECDIRYKQGKDNVVADFLSRLQTESEPEENSNVVAVVTTQQKRQQHDEKQREQVNSKTTNVERFNTSKDVVDKHSNPRQNSNWNPQMDGLDNIDFAIDEHRGPCKTVSSDEFKNALIDQLDIKRLTFSKNIISEESIDATFLILNSRSAHKELSEFVDLPHGFKDHLIGNVFSIPNKKLWGIILNGNKRSKSDTKILFKGLVDAFTNCPQYAKDAENIQIISFRNLHKPPYMDVLRFIAEKFNKHFTLYAPEKDRMWVTPEERETVLQEFHDSPLGGHVGSKRMLKRINPLFKWENMRRDIENYVKQCDSCQKNKISAANKIPMKITTTSTEPFEKIFMDIVVLPESNSGNKYGLVIQDDLTRYLTVAAMENQESQTVAKTFVNSFICKFGAPKELVTDNGTNFVSQLMKNVCKILKIKKITTTAYHPQANLVERSNRELKIYLRQFIGGDPQTWDQLLPHFTFQYNTTLNSSTGFTPFELLYGRAARIPNSIYRMRDMELTYSDYAGELKSTLKYFHDKARDNLLVSKQKRKEIYDKQSKEWQPMWGDMVLVKANPTGTGQKLQSLWRGPYEVVSFPSEQTTIVKNGKRLEKVHNNRLRKYND